jgi:hypothetical protein
MIVNLGSQLLLQSVSIRCVIIMPMGEQHGADLLCRKVQCLQGKALLT